MNLIINYNGSDYNITDGEQTAADASTALNNIMDTAKSLKYELTDGNYIVLGQGAIRQSVFTFSDGGGY